MRLIKLIALCCAWTAPLSGCATSAGAPPQEIFDEGTGNTTTVVARPCVFARERTDVAAHARDYATLVAVQIDQSGNAREYLLLYRWSTVDPRMSAPPAPGEGELHILADGRDIDLPPLPALPVSLTDAGALHVPSHGHALVRAYASDASMLRFIAGSRKLLIRMPQERLDVPFGLFEDGRSALAAFLKNTGT